MLGTSARKEHVSDGSKQQGVEQTVIALWLGHESIETTQVYLDANLELKERVLDKVAPLNGTPGRYRPNDKLLGLEACDNTDYVPGQLAVHLDNDPRHGATGHSPTRDIIEPIACGQ